MSHEPIQANFTEEEHRSRRRLSAQASGGLEWGGPHTLHGDGDVIREAMWRWDSNWYDPMWIERPYQRLSRGSTEGIPMEVLRSFDFFQGMTGKGVRGPGPMPYRNGNLHMEVYNTEGEQFGFHRGHGQDELWCQFRGHAINETEHGIVELDPGQATIVPPGISHRIIGGSGFLRWVFYSRLALTRHVDPQQQITHTRFEFTETE